MGRPRERQKFGHPYLHNKHTCHDWIFLLAFPSARRHRYLGKAAQGLGVNRSSRNHRLRLPFHRSMDRLGYGFYTAATTAHQEDLGGRRGKQIKRKHA